MTIHRDHPFGLPPEARDAARRFRGRLASPVTLWATGEGAARVGLTVSSLMVALGDQPVVSGLIDPDSDLGCALASGTPLTVMILTADDRVLADAFGGVGPAPGGAFRLGSFGPTPWGPRLTASRTWLGARVLRTEPLGWSMRVDAAIEHVEFADAPGVAHMRGRYIQLD